MSIRHSVNIHRLMELLYDKHQHGTVRGACEYICDLGWGGSDIELEGYDIRYRTWTIETLSIAKYIYSHRDKRYVSTCLLKADDLRVRWLGGPPGEYKIYTGPFLMCLIDYILYTAVDKNERLTTNKT